MLRRFVLPLTVGAAALVMLAACGGPTQSGATADAAAGDSPVPADQVIALVRKSVDTATAVHVTGEVPNGPDPVGMNLKLNLKDGTASGEIMLEGRDYPVVETADHVLYVQFNLETAVNAGVLDRTTQDLLVDKWVRSTSPLLAGQQAQLKQYLGLKHILDGFGGLPDGKVESKGEDVVDVRGSGDVYTDSAGATLYLTTTAPHDLMRINADPAKDSHGIDLTDWNKPVPVSAPPADQMFTGPGA